MNSQCTQRRSSVDVRGTHKDVRSEFLGIASDSREIRPGYLFAALPGRHADGAAFLSDAVRRGAIAVLGRPELAPAARELGVTLLADDNPRRRLARLAAEFYGAQPQTIAAITGTNGKTSVAVFLRQIWQDAGIPAASMGTIGLVTPAGESPLGHTTPDPIALHRSLAALKRDGIDHLAIEASSHGLDQYRLDGLEISAAAFTNITRDHLDYHVTFERYLDAKLRLFAELLRDNGVAVVNIDAEHSERFLSAAQRRSLRVVTVGQGEATLALCSRVPHGDGQQLVLRYRNGPAKEVNLPLVGAFQAANALIAAALAMGLGLAADSVFDALSRLRGAAGRLEKVARAANGAPIYVDYAHTPDALGTVLQALRPHVKGRIHLVFGCGGDRDKGKRPLMGAVAGQNADDIIITDDNPRSENAAAIRAEIAAACEDAREIGDRREAIFAAVSGLEAGDVLLIAGKGHETGQIVGDTIRPFSDREEAVQAALTAGGCAAERLS